MLAIFGGVDVTMMFNQNKVPVMSGITAVFFILISLTTAACNSEPQPVRSAPFQTPVPATNTPLPTTTAVILPINPVSPTPPIQLFSNAERVLFNPGSNTANLGTDLGANEFYTYTFWGFAGQILTVNIAASHKQMLFTVLDADGLEIGRTNGSRSIRVMLPKDDNYFVRIETPTENGRRYGFSLELILDTSNQSVGFGDRQPTLPPLPTTIPSTNSAIIVPVTAVPQPEHITLDPEQTTTIEGQLTANTGKWYGLSAAAGQTLTIYANATQPGIIVSVWGRDGTTFEEFRTGETFTNILPITQDYFIKITPQASNNPISYSLTLSITNLPSSPDTEQNYIRVNTNPANFNDTLHHNSGKTYIRSAQAGQTVLIDTAPADSGITITVSDEDDTILGWVTAGTQFSAIIPTDQDYYINLMLPSGVDQMTYELTITLQ